MDKTGKMLMQNIIQLNTVITTESKLSRMQELADEIKIREAEYKMLKEEIVTGYFDGKAGEYKTSKGLVLATYLEIKSSRFQSTEFEKDHPDIYTLYKKETVSYRFDLK